MDKQTATITTTTERTA